MLWQMTSSSSSPAAAVPSSPARQSRLPAAAASVPMCTGVTLRLEAELNEMLPSLEYLERTRAGVVGDFLELAFASESRAASCSAPGGTWK